MDPNSQEYIDLNTYVASLTPEVYKSMKAWEAQRLQMEKKMGGGSNPCNPCAPKGKGANPCNPCAPKRR